MNINQSYQSIDDIIKSKDMVLIYFGSKECGVCNALKPKIHEILKSYTNIVSIEVDINQSIETPSAFHIFTIPAILVYMDGKEVIREARHISVYELESKMARLYNLYYY